MLVCVDMNNDTYTNTFNTVPFYYFVWEKCLKKILFLVCCITLSSFAFSETILDYLPKNKTSLSRCQDYSINKRSRAKTKRSLLKNENSFYPENICSDQDDNSTNKSDCSLDKAYNSISKNENPKKQNKNSADKDKKDEKDEKPPNIGNFALPASQAPAPFVSFGQRLIGKDVLQLNVVADDRVGYHQYYVDAGIIIDHGITDNFVTTLFVPNAVSFKNETKDGIVRSSGMEDIYLQAEYAFLTKTTHLYSDQATIVGNISLPTGSATKNPTTGYGAVSFFTGITLSRMYPDWYLFTSHGVELPTNRRGTKFGNAFLYQFGLGKNISYITNKMIFTWLLELDGLYSERNRINGRIDPNSGGNLIYLTPSLWLSFQKLYIQFGVGWAISQQLFGVQNKYTYTVSGNIVWTF